jgi:hypothetical protein
MQAAAGNRLSEEATLSLINTLAKHLGRLGLKQPS